jgi:pimeloyl-ACP methyl ester carboxylesterase
VVQEDSVAAPATPLWGELRYGGELARLLAARSLHRVSPRADAPPVLLIPGFMAGDASLGVMRRWLRRRGHHVASSGMLANVDCTERSAARLELTLRALAAEHSARVVVVGQSRGGVIARVLAVRAPDAVGGLVMLGSPVREPLAVSPHVLRTVRWVAWLGDRGVPSLFSRRCHDGECCAEFRVQLTAPLAPHIKALSVHSRSDAIVDWRACIDPHAQVIEVDSSHCGMSVHPDVYRQLDRVLDEGLEPAWNG